MYVAWAATMHSVTTAGLLNASPSAALTDSTGCTYIRFGRILLNPICIGTFKCNFRTN